MEDRIVSLLFSLLRFSVANVPLEWQDSDAPDEQILQSLYRLGRRHDLGHLIGYALEKNGLLPAQGTFADAFRREHMTAVYRCTRMQYEYQTIAQALEAAGVAFLPLKGAVLRQLYSEIWMRTSCDIDVLVHKEDLARAEEALTGVGFSSKGEGTHDISLFSASGVHLELHYTLNDPTGRHYASLENVWSSAVLVDGTSCFYRMSDEIFYLYHVAHMAKHFLGGGCGIRPYLDLWILNHGEEYDQERRNALLEREGLLRFAVVSERLSEVWFSKAEHDALTLQMQEYLLTGGVYGSLDNRVKVSQKKAGGRGRYLMSRIFMPYERLKYMYPILQKHRWLMPVMQVRRWLARVFGGKMKRAIREVRANQALSHEEATKTERFIADIGLSS